MSAIQEILAKKVVAVVRLDDYNRAVDVARALVAGGVTVLEFTLTGRGAIEAVSVMRARSLPSHRRCVGKSSKLV